jgi:hypothetical protein
MKFELWTSSASYLMSVVKWREYRGGKAENASRKWLISRHVTKLTTYSPLGSSSPVLFFARSTPGCGVTSSISNRHQSQKLPINLRTGVLKGSSLGGTEYLS